MRIILLWCIIITCFCNCRNSPYSNCITGKDAVIPLTITINDTLNIYLDSLMVMGISTPIDYHEKENKLYVLDNYNNRLLDYSLNDTQRLIQPENIHRIKMKGKISYFRYVSSDSLLLYIYSGANLLYYSITNDLIYKKTAFINKTTGRQAAPPYANAASPLFFIDSTIVGFGFMIGESDRENPVARTVCSIIDLTTGNTRYQIPYSKVYWQHNWGGSHLRTPYTSFNEQTKNILLSLPADHNIDVIDSNGQVKEIAAGTRKNICITAMDLSKDDEKVYDAEYTLKYFFSTPSYRNIIYDPYHDRYYRILELPPTTQKQDKIISLIAFDKDFKYLGEADLPKAIALDNFFITNDGIYFLNVNNKDQNIAQYVQCKIHL